MPSGCAAAIDFVDTINERFSGNRAARDPDLPQPDAPPRGRAGRASSAPDGGAQVRRLRASRDTAPIKRLLPRSQPTSTAKLFPRVNAARG